jgi:hypothetical protein
VKRPHLVAVLLGAGLLFLVQPMSARMLLPLLGGAPAVWNTCLVFFQASLLLGYLYAHLLTSALPARAQATLHLMLLAAAALPPSPGAPRHTSPAGPRLADGLAPPRPRPLGGTSLLRAGHHGPAAAALARGVAPDGLEGPLSTLCSGERRQLRGAARLSVPAGARAPAARPDAAVVGGLPGLRHGGGGLRLAAPSRPGSRRGSPSLPPWRSRSPGAGGCTGSSWRSFLQAWCWASPSTSRPTWRRCPCSGWCRCPSTSSRSWWPSRREGGVPSPRVWRGSC